MLFTVFFSLILFIYEFYGKLFFMKITNRSLHRDIAYFYVGLIIAFSFSGIILNHRQDWYPMDYTYEATSIAKVSIEFSYKQWFNMGLESAAGLEFGHSMQTAADVKARNPGIFGMLPPSLQRAGRNIFQQGRTVWNPIGRIFKGKVFPPFT